MEQEGLLKPNPVSSLSLSVSVVWGFQRTVRCGSELQSVPVTSAERGRSIVASNHVPPARAALRRQILDPLHVGAHTGSAEGGVSKLFCPNRKRVVR